MSTKSKKQESQSNKKQSILRGSVNGKANSRASGSKGVDRSEPKIYVAGARSNINSSNIRGSSKCYSELECKSDTKQFMAKAQEDKKTQQNNKQKQGIRDKQIEQDLQRQEMMRDGLVQQSHIQVSKAQKIKIGTRFRKLVDTNHINLPVEISPVSSAVRKQQNEYVEIANDIQLNTLQSKVAVDINPVHKEGNILNKLHQEESFDVSSPMNKQSVVAISVGGSPQVVKEKVETSKVSNLLQINEQSQKQDNMSILKLGSEEQKEIQKSVDRQYILKNSRDKFQSTRQMEVNIHENQGSVRQSQLPKDKNGIPIPTNLILPQPKLSKKEKLELLSHNLYLQLKISGPNQQQVLQNQKLEKQIQLLRKTVKQLRMQKVKERAQIPDFANISSRYNKSQTKTKRQKPGPTLIEDLNVETQQNHVQIIQKRPVYFGRIKKNKSVNKSRATSFNTLQEIELQTPYKNHTIFSAQKQKSQNRAKLSISERVPSQLSCQKQYKTVQLDKITESNMQDSLRFINPYASRASRNNSSRVSKKATEICEKVMTKFQSDDKKFQKFLIREQSKTRSRYRRNDEEKRKISEEANPQLSKSSRSKEVEKAFEGTIVKNISNSMCLSKEYIENHSQNYSFMTKQVLNFIRQAQKHKLQKKEIQFTKIMIPSIPTPPTSQTETEQIMELILKVLPYSDETYTEEDLKHCLLRKYKNCIMFQLPNNNNFKLVWYFSGKLYIGDWDYEKNEKSGEGLEYNRSKYYYRGQFSRGKRNGKGIFIHANGSIYEGQFLDGQRNGTGKYKDSINKSIYEGSWKKGKMNGWGYFEYHNTIFEGQFQDDFKQGFGSQIFSQGDKYYGEYAADKFHGQGKYIWANDSQYIGHFRQGMRHDFGRWISTGDKPEVYQGFYTKDKKQGSGRYVWQNGCVYEGSFDNDLKHGIGNMQYPDGQWMEGIWAQGILTDVISKVSEAQVEDPLKEPSYKQLQTRIKIKVMEIGEKDEV